MAYIGTRPTVGNFVKLDSIVTSATATYNLLNGGVAYSPQSANHCIVSLNGVIQSPNTSFTISGSTIVFASALTASDVIDFILVLGDVLNIGTPSDATVTFPKVTSNLITGATAVTVPATDDVLLCYDTSATALRKITFANFGNAPAFMAYNAGVNTQSIATTAWTEITIYDTELFDTNSAFNTTTSRFTPQIAGKYVFFASVNYTQAPTGGCFIGITKNGNITGNTSDNYLFQTNNIYGMTGSCILDLNGTTDYVSAYTLHSHGSSRNIGGGTYNSFYGYRLIGI